MDDEERQQFLARIEEQERNIVRLEAALANSMEAKLNEDMARDALRSLGKSLGRKQLLLIKLMEECGEVVVEVSKALHFGVLEIKEGQALTNGQRAARELADLLGVVDMLVDEGVIDPAIVFATSLHAEKRAKVETWLEFSAKCGVYRKGAPE